MAFEEPIYRPPWEAASVLIPLTQSCNWNRCKFCYRSKDYPFKVASPEVFESELKAMLSYYPPDADVFFVGSNNFALPAKMLAEFIEIVNREMPEHGKISMFSRVDAIAKKNDEQLTELRNLSPLHLYVGTENGCDAILDMMDKGHTAAQAEEQLKRLDKAGIAYTVFYILGLGGKGMGEQAAKSTAELFNKIHPVRIVTTGMTVTDGTGAREMEQKGCYVQASEREKIEELKTFIENLTVDTFYDGMHSLNPLRYRFDNSNAQDKAAVLDDIDKVLNSYTDGELEQMINRKLMEEYSKPQNA